MQGGRWRQMTDLHTSMSKHAWSSAFHTSLSYYFPTTMLLTLSLRLCMGHKMKMSINGPISPHRANPFSEPASDLLFFSSISNPYHAPFWTTSHASLFFPTSHCSPFEAPWPCCMPSSSCKVLLRAVTMPVDTSLFLHLHRGSQLALRCPWKRLDVYFGRSKVTLYSL